MSSSTVTTWSLEQTSPSDLLPAAASEGDDVRVVRSEVPSPEFSRFLYASVGGDIRWVDRLAWSYARWEEYLNRPGVETWVAYDRGTPAGYVEFEAQDDGVVEIGYFGLIPAFRGRRIGGHLLSYGTARAWDLAERWPELPPTKRVWLHTCSRDGEHAMGNYLRRGFKLFDTKVTEEAEVAAPGPWPGAQGPGPV
ncbi:GNAT family N-acetyltransferase [Streptomyces ipomoeae]|jgi:GNAT superfamily N-acetyltransferase|uniref:Acetyltransferase, GNAT family n=2 Tax=Streptomyces ipomoeae TaxID=103232 RepID=L1L318_9ACTN|nr:GNAT family N-acetyltransferase [Streptomyces ipomoeae]EKX67100.1 acetyltransferase, GNAT family [Streptomyces ipomoeae 91-03]MDX2694862.1 GNAT family N-acetyltransferase [Streptomyces ipomoeae]MDX2827077.1 GNAT family N-acetyltransferase [Streptomyces ipomoeae]MDX2838465.1 GNAT family N-acetyltransferase [Streptomyces ipomoeae]MDX2875499.1 GNAT family N-acetyltransferase [Streptomyces ipomoeae]